MSLSYAHEKLTLAMDSLAISPASIQMRVANAYIYHLIHLRPEDLTPEPWRELTAIGQETNAAGCYRRQGQSHGYRQIDE